MKIKENRLITLLLIVVFIAIIVGNALCVPLEQFKTDTNGRLAPPSVTYNPNTEEYELPYIKTDDDGNQHFKDERYLDYISTGTAGRMTSTGTILNVPELVTDYSFSVKGGTAEITVTGKSGVIYVDSGSPYNSPVFSILPTNITITLKSLTPGATQKYDINGGKLQ